MLFDHETILFLKVTIEKDGFLELPAHGNSMFPLIKRGDVCRFVPYSPDSLMKEDIILFHNDQGQLIAHRFISVEEKHDVLHYLFKGDTNIGYDQPVTADQLIGRLTYIKKKQQQISTLDATPQLWGKLLLALPFLSGALRKYLNSKSHYTYLWSTLWRKWNSL